jgi:hypothetical protein
MATTDVIQEMSKSTPLIWEECTRQPACTPKHYFRGASGSRKTIANNKLTFAPQRALVGARGRRIQNSGNFYGVGQ